MKSFRFISSSCLLFLFAISSYASEFQVHSQDLESAISERRKRVVEFQYLSDWGAKHGVRIYGAGGTAAGLAHYVKQDLEREWLKQNQLPKKYFDSRFGYDYYDVFRSTQDADIVIDIPGADQAHHEELGRQLESDIQSKFPHTQGSKSVWEVRFLKVGRGTPGDPGYKDPLLSDDFLKQHSDSHSTGLIEITDPLPPESPTSIVKDVKAWGQVQVPFLQDVTDGVLTYYHEPGTHFQTLRAKNGLNPEILSVIRYYTKAFQYGLKTNPKQEVHIRQIIQGFKPKEVTDSYVRKQINNNGLKLFWHAQDVEFAWNELDRMGLRQKLVQFEDAQKTGTVSQWLNREPLRGKPVGLGSGKTAAELGITITAHETNQFLAYENITRSSSGIPNVFISRGNAPGESAVYGDGFYTKIGKEGARGTGLTIRFEWDPNAREGTDFTVYQDYVMIQNRNAVRIIEESIELEPYDYFKLLFDQKGIEKSDLGLFEKLERKISAKLDRISGDELQKIIEFLKIEFRKNFMPWKAANRWFQIPISKNHPELIEILLHYGRFDTEIARFVLSQPRWADRPEWVAGLIKKGTADEEIIKYVLSQPHWKDHPEFVEALLKTTRRGWEIAEYVLSQPHWKDHPEWVEELIKKGTADQMIVMHVLPQPHWKDHPEWVEALIKKGKTDMGIVMHVLNQPHWSGHPEWVEALLKNKNSHEGLAKYVLGQPEWKDHPEWVEKLIKKGTVDWVIAQYVLSQPQWKNHPEWVEKLIKRESADQEIADYVLSQPHWKDHPQLRQLSNGVEPSVENIRNGLKNKKWFMKCVDLLK